MGDRDFEYYWHELKVFLMKYRREKSKDRSGRTLLCCSFD